MNDEKTVCISSVLNPEEKIQLDHKSHFNYIIGKR